LGDAGEVWHVEQFWQEQIANLAQRYPLFCQENTFLTSKVISGLEKFPIQYWNNPGEKLACSGSDKSGLELKDLGVAGFFYKSGYKALEAQRIAEGNSTKRKDVTSTQPGVATSSSVYGVSDRSSSFRRGL